MEKWIVVGLAFPNKTDETDNKQEDWKRRSHTAENFSKEKNTSKTLRAGPR